MTVTLRNTILILAGAIIGVTVIGVISATKSENFNQSNNLPKPDSIVENSSSFPIKSFEAPKNANFAGEVVPVENIEVKEALDKELLTNVYWQSNMMFYIKRANRWFPVIESILKENKIPDDFKYLAVIESGLLNATSPSGAKGFWQFMPNTASDYNLEINDYVDERNNLVKSTQAACQYLQSAFELYGNWTLAAASYNMGKTGLLTSLQTQQVNNYYDLFLNPETARYVYRIIAVKYIISNPNAYGFSIPAVHLYPPYKTKIVEVNTSIENLVDFAIANKTNYKTIKLLNPWLINRSLIIKGNKTYQILLPETNSGLNNVGETDNKYGNGN